VKTLLLAVFLTSAAAAQSVDGTQPPAEKASKKAKKGAGRDIASGTANIGTGAAKGATSLGKGTARGVTDLATLHPIDAATSVAGGAVSAGKNVTVGTAKGAGKITRGVGKALKKIF